MTRLLQTADMRRFLMRKWAAITLIASLTACSGESQRIDADSCSADNPCALGQSCEAGVCTDANTAADPTESSEPSEPDNPALTTDAAWPASAEQYTSSHLTLLTSLELAPTSDGNKFGDLLRFLATQADISVDGYFDEYLRSGGIVSLLDHQGIAATSESQTFLLSHLNGAWADGMDWDTIVSGDGSVYIHPENFAQGATEPSGAYESATLIDGNLLGSNGNLLLDIPEGNILSSINIHESQLMADSIALSNESISYSATLSGWVSIAEFYESLNRSFENLCGCAGIAEAQNVWSEIEPGTYECMPDTFDTENCVGTENEELCTGALPLCTTLTYIIRGDIDADPDIPDEDAMSVLLNIETTSITLLPMPSVENTDEAGAKSR
jgi:hypothetical protein